MGPDATTTFGMDMRSVVIPNHIATRAGTSTGEVDRP